MNCKEINKNIVRYLENKLEDSPRQQFEDHLSVCVNCKKTIAEFKRLYEVTKVEKNEFVHNPFLGTKIWSKINTTQNVPHTKEITLRQFAITYVAAAGLIIGIVMGTLLSRMIFNDSNSVTEESWAQLSEEYFPFEIYQPYEELESNE